MNNIRRGHVTYYVNCIQLCAVLANRQLSIAVTLNREDRSAMAEEEKKAGFWATLPGILTGVAAVMTAVGGLILGLYQYGVLGSKRAVTTDITAQDGTVTTVFADSLKHRQYSRELVLQNGQHISFDNIKMLEVVRLYDDHAKVKITLLNDKVVEGSLDAGLYPFGFEAQNDIGQFGISVSQLKRIVF